MKKFDFLKKFKKKQNPDDEIEQSDGDTNAEIDIDLLENDHTQEINPKKMGKSFKKFDWDELLLKVFHPSSRVSVHKFFIVTFVITSSYLVGKFTAMGLSLLVKESKPLPSAMVASYKSKKRFRPIMEKIKDNNIFHALVNDETVEKVVSTKAPKRKKRGNVSCTSSNQKSSLPVKLISTTVLQESTKSLATVSVKSKKSLVNIREGDLIDNVATIGRVKHKKLVVQNIRTGDCEYIEIASKKKRKKAKNNYKILPPGKGRKLLNAKINDSIKNEGNHFTIKKAFRDEILKDMNDVLTQARAVKMKNPDGSLSFKITEIVPGSIYSQLNIQNGDVITAIDGKKIQSLNEVMSLFGRIKQIDSMQLTMKKNGIEQNYDYDFE
ncbi:MAG: PDZ domain-containing protein [Bacteriovoracaceae bacterium]|nr:PDZ domain-containing protein [Bacteriovoracaceae bacterium]